MSVSIGYGDDILRMIARVSDVLVLTGENVLEYRDKSTKVMDAMALSIQQSFFFESRRLLAKKTNIRSSSRDFFKNTQAKD